MAILTHDSSPLQVVGNSNKFKINSTFSEVSYNQFYFSNTLSVYGESNVASTYSFRTPPDATDSYIFDFSNILKSSLKPNLNYTTTDFTVATTSIIQYKFNVNGNYGGIKGTYSSNYYLSLLGSIDVEDYREWNNGSVYRLGTSSSKFLTTSPSKKEYATSNDSETLSGFFIAPIGSTHSISFAKYTSFNSLGATQSTAILPNSKSALVESSGILTDYQKARFDVPVGVKNLSNMFGTQTPISSSTDSYTVQLFEAYSAPTATDKAKIELYFNSFGTDGESFTVRVHNNITNSNIDETFTFKNAPTNDNELLDYSPPFVDDWLISDIVNKIQTVFTGYDVYVKNATSSNGVIVIETGNDVTFSFTYNDTSNIVGVASPLTQLNPFNLVLGGDNGTFQTGITGVTCSAINVISHDSVNKRLLVYTDDLSSSTTVTISVTVRDLIPNTNYKLSFNTYSDVGGRNDTLDCELNGFAGITPIEINNTIQPHTVATASSVGYYRTGTDTSGRILFTYTIPATPVGGDGIGFFIDNIKLQLVASEAPVSEIKKYKIGSTQNFFNKQRVLWLNRLGAFDYFNFQAIEDVKTVNEKRNYSNYLPYNYDGINAREQNVYSSETFKTYRINTGNVDESYDDFFTDLMYSTLVYFDNGSGVLKPVNVVDTEFMNFVKGRDKVKSYTFTFVDANKNRMNN